ncbi:MAG: hypothetical protein ABIH53_01930 [archaeon]
MTPEEIQLKILKRIIKDYKNTSSIKIAKEFNLSLEEVVELMKDFEQRNCILVRAKLAGNNWHSIDVLPTGRDVAANRAELFGKNNPPTIAMRDNYGQVAHINGHNAQLHQHQHQHIDKSVTYDIDKHDTTVVENLSIFVTNRYGEKKPTILGAISTLVGLLEMWFSIKSVFPLFGFDWIPTINANLANGLFIMGLVLLVFGIFLIILVQYKHESRCQKCGKFYAMKETGEPTAKEVHVKDGIRRTTYREYTCKYCGNKKNEKYLEFIPNTSD